MMTLQQFSLKPETIPASTSSYLADLSEARGKQELFTRQTPQRPKVLREHALIESAVSSNRIEGVQIDQSRINTVVFGRAHLRDRNEEEIRGYRNALWIFFASILFEMAMAGFRGYCFFCSVIISALKSGVTLVLSA